MWSPAKLVALCAALLAFVATAAAQSARPGFVSATADKVLLDIPPRYMWGWKEGHGYCGESSFGSALLYYGSYVSQERVRYAAGNKELLIGVHDEKAAKALSLSYEAFDFDEEENPHANAFANFVIRNIDKGAPIVAGFYLKKKNGDEDYDHIMPVVGYEGNNDGGSIRKTPTKLSLTYNDLYLAEHRVIPGADLFKTRSQCSTSTAKQPYNYCLPKETNYGIALTGNVNPQGAFVRAMLRADAWSEPDWGAEDGLDETPVPVGLTLTAYGLTVGAQYAAVRFDSVAALGDSKDVLSKDYAARVDFTAASEEHTLETVRLMSDGAYFFRVVMVADAEGNVTPQGEASKGSFLDRFLHSGHARWVALGLGALIVLAVVTLIAVAACRAGGKYRCGVRGGFCCFGGASSYADVEAGAVDLDARPIGPAGSTCAATDAADASPAADAAAEEHTPVALLSEARSRSYNAVDGLVESSV